VEIGVLLRVCGERGEVVVGPGVNAGTVQGVGGGAYGVGTLFGVVEEWRVGGVGCGGLAVSLGVDFDFVFYFFWRRGKRCAVGL